MLSSCSFLRPLGSSLIKSNSNIFLKVTWFFCLAPRRLLPYR
nr:MAG TPA: hypothetical protein [Caudoviricetes sp.]